MIFSLSAICTNPCQNGGTCTAPETCTCDVGWTGVQCETGAGFVSKINCILNVFRNQTNKGTGIISVAILIHCNWACLFFICSLIFPFSAINCGDPGTPTNGQRTLSSTTYNSVVTYTCDVGYTLQGSNSRTCQSSGQWSGSVPQCSSELEIQGSIYWGWSFSPKHSSLPHPHPPPQIFSNCNTK